MSLSALIPSLRSPRTTRLARWVAILMLTVSLGLSVAAPLMAQAQDGGISAPVQEHRPGGEVNLRLPDLNQGDFLGFTGHQILLSGLVVCVLACSSAS
jgi:hypothetical protein